MSYIKEALISYEEDYQEEHEEDITQEMLEQFDNLYLGDLL